MSIASASVQALMISRYVCGSAKHPGRASPLACCEGPAASVGRGVPRSAAALAHPKQPERSEKDGAVSHVSGPRRSLGGTRRRRMRRRSRTRRNPRGLPGRRGRDSRRSKCMAAVGGGAGFRGRGVHRTTRIGRKPRVRRTTRIGRQLSAVADRPVDLGRWTERGRHRVGSRESAFRRFSLHSPVRRMGSRWCAARLALRCPKMQHVCPHPGPRAGPMRWEHLAQRVCYATRATRATRALSVEGAVCRKSYKRRRPIVTF